MGLTVNGQPATPAELAGFQAAIAEAGGDVPARRARLPFTVAARGAAFQAGAGAFTVNRAGINRLPAA